MPCASARACDAFSQLAAIPPSVALVGVELNPGPARGDGVAMIVEESTFILHRATFAAPAVCLTFTHLGLTELAIGSRVCRHWRDSLAQLQFSSLSIAGQLIRNRLLVQAGLSALFPPQLRPYFAKLTQLNLPHAHIGAVELQLPRTLLSFTPYSIASTALHGVGSLTHLQCLHLHFRRQSERNIRVHASSFLDQLRSCSQLTELAVSHCAFFREDFESMFQHHLWLSTLQLNDVCTHLGKQDTTMLQVLQSATQLTSLSLLRLCGGTLDSNLLHLRQCSSLCKLTLECQPHRLDQLRSLLMEPELDHEQWSLIASGGLTVRSAQVSGRSATVPSVCRSHRTRGRRLDSSSGRPSKLQRLTSSSAVSSGPSVELSPWPSTVWRRHLFLRTPFSAPWTGLSQLYKADPHASLDNGLRLEVDVERCHIGEPLQFRVVADRPFHRGEAVTWYGGLPVFKRSFAAHNLPKTHARLIPSSDFVLDGLPLAWMLQRPVLTDAAQLNWAAAHMNQLRPDHPSSPFTAVEVNLWRSTPIGYMINTADDGGVNNVCIQHVPFAHRTCEIPRMHATRDIQVGEELLCAYHQFS